jgi:hypothetical protein
MPVMTLVRGKVVMRDGDIVAAPGWGQQVEVRMPPPVVKNADRTTRAITEGPFSPMV